MWGSHDLVYTLLKNCNALMWYDFKITPLQRGSMIKIRICRGFFHIKNLLFGPCSVGALWSSDCLSIHLSIHPSVCLSTQDLLSRAYLLSHWPNLAQTSPTECFGVKGMQWPWTMFLSWIWRSWQNYMYMKNHCLEHIFSPLCSIWLKLHSQSACGQCVCSDLEWSL